MKALSVLAAIAIVGVLTVSGTTIGTEEYEENTAGGGGWFLQADGGNIWVVPGEHNHEEGH